MTLLCGVLGDGEVLVASDTARAHDDDALSRQHLPVVLGQHDKFRATGSSSLLVGFAGDERVAAPLLASVVDRHWETWEQLCHELEVATATAVGRARERVRERGGDGDDPRLDLAVMAAGYVGHDAGILTIDVLGRPWMASDRHFPHVLGTASGLATVAWRVLQSFHPEIELRVADDLGRFMDAVCAAAASLGTPADVWSITASGVRRIARGLKDWN